jgi:glycosyltransferase involved in cell wall biosynthesis
VHHASTRPRRLPRALDTATTLLRVGPSLDVAVIAVFGNLGFAMAEVATALATKRGAPVVLVLHGGSLPSLAARNPRRVRRLLERASIVTAPSPFLARELGNLRGDIAVVPNALPLPEYPSRTRARVRPRLLWMRTFEAVYRPQMAIEVLAVLRKSDPSVTLTLAGQDKGFVEPVRRRAAELGVADAVEFPGFLDPARKRRAFEDHDLFLSTSEVDNAPVSVLEAARCGLVVVGADVGGLGDVLTHGENALLVPDGDVPAMAGAVQRVFDDACLAGALSESGQDLGSRSTREQLTPRWEEILRTAGP